LVDRDGYYCCWCGRKLLHLDLLPKVADGTLPDNYPTLEHILKRSRGGENKPFNLKLSCPHCNSTRDKREDAQRKKY
jgi:5-methylcytosine-specific restriction endonuclease McrA